MAAQVLGVKTQRLPGLKTSEILQIQMKYLTELSFCPQIRNKWMKSETLEQHFSCILSDLTLTEPYRRPQIKSDQ